MPDFSTLMEGLSDPKYVHVLLNHLPLTGLAVATVALLISPLFASRRTILFMLLVVGVLSFTAYPVAMFGEQAHASAERLADAEGQRWLEHHASLASTWKWLYYATGLVAFVALAIGAMKAKSLWVSVPLVVVLSVASLAQGMRIAESGGMIRHTEFRQFDELPAKESGDQQNARDAADDSAGTQQDDADNTTGGGDNGDGGEASDGGDGDDGNIFDGTTE
jgi:hypothetical protein